MEFLVIFLMLFGFGCILGAIYGFVKVGIPTLVWGVGQLIEGVREGVREGWRQAKEDVAQERARNAYRFHRR
jgi:hypothetical protein